MSNPAPESVATCSYQVTLTQLTVEKIQWNPTPETLTAVVSNGTPVTILSPAMAKKLGFECIDKTAAIDAELKSRGGGDLPKYDYVVSGLKVAPVGSKFECEIKWALVVSSFTGDCQLGVDFMRAGNVEMFVLFNFVGMLHVTPSGAAPYEKPHDGREYLRIMQTVEDL